MLVTIFLVLALVFAIISVVPGVPGPVPWLSVSVILTIVALLIGHGFALR